MLSPQLIEQGYCQINNNLVFPPTLFGKRF